MIEFQNVYKRFRLGGQNKIVLDHVSTVFERGHSYGVLGVNGAGKSTMLKLIAGTMMPTSGKIRRDVKISWPLGLSLMNPLMTGRNNIPFAARAYGQDVREVLDFVEDFSELGDYLDVPIGTYSSGMSAKLGFAVSMAIQFDVYLIDEATAVGDARFIKRCEAAFSARRAFADVLMVSHQVGTIKSFCDRGAVLVDGRLMMFNDIDHAIDVYNRLNR